MPAIARHHVHTLDDYFAAERGSPRRHEYSLGQIYLMAGGSPRHNYLAGRAVAVFTRALEGGPCFPLASDQRIRVAEGEYTYADASVFCGGVDVAEEQTATNPVLLVEVLSNSTRTYDRGDKLESYKAMPSVRHVMLMETDAVDVEVWSRRGDGWVRAVHVDAADLVRLDGLGVDISVADLYAGADRVPA
jgi:Uma2 family endonuclease